MSRRNWRAKFFSIVAKCGVKTLLIHIEQLHAIASDGRYMRDAVAHLPGTDNTDYFDH